MNQLREEKRINIKFYCHFWVFFQLLFVSWLKPPLIVFVRWISKEWILSFSMSMNALISPVLLSESFPGYEILDPWLSVWFLVLCSAL
jgi:hypothetical protein